MLVDREKTYLHLPQVIAAKRGISVTDQYPLFKNYGNDPYEVYENVLSNVIDFLGYGPRSSAVNHHSAVVELPERQEVAWLWTRERLEARWEGPLFEAAILTTPDNRYQGEQRNLRYNRGQKPIPRLSSYTPETKQIKEEARIFMDILDRMIDLEFDKQQPIRDNVIPGIQVSESEAYAQLAQRLSRTDSSPRGQHEDLVGKMTARLLAMPGNPELMSDPLRRGNEVDISDFQATAWTRSLPVPSLVRPFEVSGILFEAVAFEGMRGYPKRTTFMRHTVSNSGVTPAPIDGSKYGTQRYELESQLLTQILSAMDESQSGSNG